MSKQNQDSSSGKKTGFKTEYLVIPALLIPLALGAFLFFGSGPNGKGGDSPLGSLFGLIGMNGKETAQATPDDYNGWAERAVPQGEVGDVGVYKDPQTDEFVLEDRSGSFGSNVTSVDGVQRMLVEDMLKLDQYAEDNKRHLPFGTYQWMKDLAKTGTKLALGRPGRSPDEQQQYRRQMLQRFQQAYQNRPQDVDERETPGMDRLPRIVQLRRQLLRNTISQFRPNLGLNTTISSTPTRTTSTIGSISGGTSTLTSSISPTRVGTTLTNTTTALNGTLANTATGTKAAGVAYAESLLGPMDYTNHTLTRTATNPSAGTSVDASTSGVTAGTSVQVGDVSADLTANFGKTTNLNANVNTGLTNTSISAGGG